MKKKDQTRLAPRPRKTKPRIDVGGILPPFSDACIETTGDIERGVAAIRMLCPVMAGVAERVGLPPLRRYPDGLVGLARVVVGQQLSIASAAAIWGRVEARVQPFDALTLGALSDSDLRATGLSAPKIRTLRALCAATVEGLDLAAIRDASVEDAHSRLTAISGIGPWTADIYLMFCLGRADAFAPGDLALQLAAQSAFELADRPSPADLLILAERWRPWRAIAARLLWAHYAHTKTATPPTPV